jgi:hypothetical protein
MRAIRATRPKNPTESWFFVLLGFQELLRADFSEHRRLLALDPLLFYSQILALLPRRIGRTVQRPLAGNALRLAAAQVLGDLARDDPALTRLGLGRQLAGPAFK